MAKKDLREMKKKKRNKNEEIKKAAKETLGKDIEVGDDQVKEIENAEEVIKRYEGKNEDELLTELKDMRKKGEFNNEMIDNFFQNVSPMLDDDQKNRLKRIMQMLNKEPD